jgi:hypothetical protein
MVRQGRSSKEISEAIGDTTPEAVRQQAHRLGLKRNRTERPHGAYLPSSSQEGLLARVARVLGRRPPSEEPGTVAVDDDAVRRWADPLAFLSWLGIPLHTYQRDALALIAAHDRTVLAWSRQAGKDHLTAAYALWVAATSPGSVVVCVSPSQRQSDLWLDRLKSFALSRREMRSEVADMSQTELSLTNSSRINSLPSGAQGGATIRGFAKVSLLVFNESAWIIDEIFAAAQPFLAATGSSAKQVLISTPFGQSNFFWRAWNSDLYAKSHVTAHDCPHISTEFLEKEKASMDSLTFASEYMAEFLSAQDSYFPSELIQRCVEAYPIVESPLPEYRPLRFYLGCDWGRIAGADKTVLTIVGVDQEGHGGVLWIKSFDGVDYTVQADYVGWLDRTWRFTRIYSDASNHAENDLLRAKGVSVESVNFTVGSKIELFGRLKNAMEAGKITLPQHPDLLRELSTFRYRISPTGNLLLHHVEGGHDDYVDSLGLAAREVTTVEVWDRASVLGTATALASLSEIAAGGGTPSTEVLNRLEAAHKKRWNLP